MKVVLAVVRHGKAKSAVKGMNQVHAFVGRLDDHDVAIPLKDHALAIFSMWTGTHRDQELQHAKHSAAVLVAAAALTSF